MRLGAEQPHPASLQAHSSAHVCAGPTGPEGLLSDAPTLPLETVQEVKGNSISEEAPPVSISDDPDIAWDLMASGFLILTGQWASVLKRKGSRKENSWGGVQREAGWMGGSQGLPPARTAWPFCVFRRGGPEWASSADHYPTVLS